MKALLINPPRSPFNALLDHASEASLKYIHRKLIGPPLGLLTIASALEDECDLELLDAKGIYDLYEQQGTSDVPSPSDLVRERIAAFAPDLVGATFIASELDDGMKMLRTAKTADPGVITVAGGLHTTLCPEHFRDPAVDIICPGESTKKIRGIVRAGRDRNALLSVPGIYVREADGTYRHTGPAEPVDTAGADYLMPKRSLVAPYRATYVVGKAPGPSTYMFTSLGCNNRCTFCSIWPQYNGRYRQRDIESIVAELKTIPDYPVVRFADANTLVHAEFLSMLFRRIKEEGIRKSYIMDMRADAVAAHPALIEQLAEGGLKVVISGFESFRNEELKRYNKSADAALIRRAVEIFHENDIMIRGNYVVPPDYTEHDFKALREWAGSHAVAYAGYTVLTPMPGTAMWNEMKEKIVDFDLRKYNFFNCVTRTALPLETFYRRTADLWSVRQGEDIL